MASDVLNLRAETRWRSIPADIQQKILGCVWCGKCAQGQPISDWKLTVREDVVVIDGNCSVCSGPCARVIEDP